MEAGTSTSCAETRSCSPARKAAAGPCLAQLVEVPASTVLWSQTIQVPIGDLFGVQDQITNQLVKALAIPLTAHERSMLTKDVPASARAYDLYLRANEMGRDTRR